MKKGLRKFFESLKQTIKLFPVEFAIILYAFVFGSLLYEDVLSPYDDGKHLALVPLFFAFTYIMNNLARCPRCRWAYYLSWLPVALLWWVDVSDWIFTTSYFVALICAFLGVLICRKVKDNELLAKESLKYILNIAVSFAFAAVAHLAMIAIYFSVSYIFGFDWDADDFLFYSSMLSYVVAVSLLFLTFNYSNLSKDWQSSKFLDILLNFILTPALLIYTAVLYVYFLKIAIVWSLPEGMIAMMVLVFAAVAILVKAWQPLLGKRYYDWFFKRFWLISLPALLMFWISVVYRIKEYGFTELRIYLLLGGVILTLTIMMSLFGGKIKYFHIGVSAMLLLAVFTYLPFMSAKNLAFKDQRNRVLMLATQLDMLDQDGKFKPKENLPSYDESKDEKYMSLYESFDYITYSDYNTFGISSVYELKQLYDIDPYPTNSSYNVYISNDNASFDLRGYHTLSKVSNSSYASPMYYYSLSENALSIYERLSSEEIEKLKEESAQTNQSPEVQESQADNDRTNAEAEIKEMEVVVCYDDEGEVKVNEYKLILSIDKSILLEQLLQKIGYTLDAMPSSETMMSNNPEMFTYESGDYMLAFSYMSLTKDSCGRGEISYIDVEFLLQK